MTINMKKNIGNRVKSLRSTRKMTQALLAEKIGVSTEAVSNIERGINYPSFDTLVRIAVALDCTLADIVDIAGKGSQKRMKAEADLVGIIKSLPDDRMETAVKLLSALL